MERLKKLVRAGRRSIAGILAIVLTISGITAPIPVHGSEIWPQKSTAPFYCLDGGKGWKSTDRYEIYQFDTLPSALSEVQAKRLFWAYPTNWNALKEASKVYDPELYNQIAGTVSGPNVVKRVKDDAGTMFAWIADHPEMEARAIRALEQAAIKDHAAGKEAPEAIREATSEETAVSFTIPPFSAGPGALDTEFRLGSAFIQDIAKIEAQSVWDNGSDGGNVGWLDASQDKNIARSVLGDSLYEITWNGDSIKIRNNGSVTANENAIGSSMSEEEKYNKTTVRYKITMRKDSGWYTEGSWNENYLREWMDFKACVNAPGQQRLYKADIRIVPSDMVFYLVIGQGDIDGTTPAPTPEYGSAAPNTDFQVYRHEETFETNYHVKLKKVDDETGMPLKGSQFYLYERFEDADVPGDTESNGALSWERIDFSPWDGFQVFAEGITDGNGEITHTDTRNYVYSKTYCDGHGMPEWTEIPEEEGDEEEGSDDSGAEEARDKNRAAASQWLEIVSACEAASGETHFHWLRDSAMTKEVESIANSGEPGGNSISGADAKTAFRESGCEADCEETYNRFIHLRFSYTWKEIQARNGYILHDVHEEDIPVEIITTDSSEAGAHAERSSGSSRDIRENIWYAGNDSAKRIRSDAAESVKINSLPMYYSVEAVGTGSNAAVKESEIIWNPDTGWDEDDEVKTDSDARESTESNADTGTNSNADAVTNSNADEDSREERETLFDRVVHLFFRRGSEKKKADDGDWGDAVEGGDFAGYLLRALEDGIRHLPDAVHDRYSYESGAGREYWIVRDHRTEGEIHINKRDMDLFEGEGDIYSSYGDTEGDSSLEGAVYGLFAAEDILHPDSDIDGRGNVTNTGYVYKKHDLVSVAETDRDGNAHFLTYTEAPGRIFDYKSEMIVDREDTDWTGPVNLYQDNQEKYGNWWIGRPLILGKYYVKELRRSEGYELSVNGKSQEWTNHGVSFETPESIANANGIAVVSMPELAASMEGEEWSGNGYDQLSFSVTSAGTTNTISGTNGYELLLHGFPEDTKFYRVDSGEQEVTGPHVTGTEDVIVRDDQGNVVWKVAESDTDYVKYEPTYDTYGKIIGQTAMHRIEPQVLKAQQIPAVKDMVWTYMETDLSEEELDETVSDDSFFMLKAEVEEILNRNGYDTPRMADGTISTAEHSVYSVGVRKGDIDEYGMTTEAGEPAEKTVYGAAVQSVEVMCPEQEELTVGDILVEILTWYQENPQWSFGGIHSVRREMDRYEMILYAGVSTSGNRRFFTMKEDNGKLVADKVYAVLENPVTLRWEYQEYGTDGDYRYQIERQYYYGGGDAKRYYMDVTLTPAVMINPSGEREDILHSVMVYHEEGEEIIDYRSGDAVYGYRVPETEQVDKIEITTELEVVETDVALTEVTYDHSTGVHRISVATNGVDAFGKEFSDADQSLTLSFMAQLPEKRAELKEHDIETLGTANVQGYKSGDRIGYAQYLMLFRGAAVAASTGNRGELNDTYIVAKELVYRGQHRIKEDGDSEKIPVQVLQRPIKQKIKVIKRSESEEPVGNFRFKIYLLSNLERLYRSEDGTVFWQDRNGEEVDITAYRLHYPELVQKIYTKETERLILETEKDGYNYKKFFDAINVSNIDRWHNEGNVQNTSWKPFAFGMFTGVLNEINTSDAARENARRSDAVRQFAVAWYLEEEIEKLTSESKLLGGNLAKNGEVMYQDQIYDRALYEAILKAEDYLKPFFFYDMDSIYEIAWDSEMNGGIDGDASTLSADFLSKDRKDTYAYGTSPYLPYGTYVIVEQQPYYSEWNDFVNRHYEIDEPKEISLPVYMDHSEQIPFPEVDWSVTEPGIKSNYSGYAEQEMLNHKYRIRLRLEKTDKETGEPIMHEDAVFALYRAERNEDSNGDGAVKRYEIDSVIAGTRPFLEAMGAENITPFARSVGNKYFGLVPAGTPICKEEDVILFYDSDGQRGGIMQGLETVADLEQPDILQTTGYLETPEPVDAGVYVLAELKVPPGYVRSQPMPIEVYSDKVMYYPDGGEKKVGAIIFGEESEDMDFATARIFINNTATSLEVSKMKTVDAYRSMKISGRVEGTITELDKTYGLENLELAYNSMGTYMGFGWKKGTLEYLEHRKMQGERIELVYENGVFQGYGYVTRALETADDDERYVSDAVLALYDAIELRLTGDSEDYRYEGLRVMRDRNGNVTDILVEEPFAGEKCELTEKDGLWKVDAVKRGDTPVLFYDLGNLKVMEQDEQGRLYGYDRQGQKMMITFDTESIFAVRGGKAVLELTGGNFEELIYDRNSRAFTKVPEGMVIYHLEDGYYRDAQVDGYTGLAYVETSGKNSRGETEPHIFVWPVTKVTNDDGTLISREKILTGRPGEVKPGTEHAYITGTWDSETKAFEKTMEPVYDRFGMVQYYLPNGENYKKGQGIFDRDGEYLGYRYEDLLDEYNRASYYVRDEDALYATENGSKSNILHRNGEAWIIPNILETEGKDLLRRVIPGTYIMEELKAPDGYVRALPMALSVKETEKVQRISMTDEKTKVEISKVDESGYPVSGAKMALYPARRVYVSDYEKYPKGYYLVRESNLPITWMTGEQPKYIEGIAAGDYLLEEQEAPVGYIKATMEITIQQTEELQAFFLVNECTKVDIFKYETDESGHPVSMPMKAGAELTLYPAVLDENGAIVYATEHPVDSWIARDQSKYTSAFSDAFEAMFLEHRDTFKTVSWKSVSWESELEDATRVYHAERLESHRTSNGEKVVQIWQMEDGSLVRICISCNSGKTRVDEYGRRIPVFSYQFHYRETDLKNGTRLVGYDTADGHHVLERIPVGVYVLVETGTPDGYETADDQVITVEETGLVQKFSMENHPLEKAEQTGELSIKKTDAEHSDKILSGAVFELKNMKTGQVFRKTTDENGEAVFCDIPAEGLDEDGRREVYAYRLKEIAAPDGYLLETIERYFQFDQEKTDELAYHLTVENRKKPEEPKEPENPKEQEEPDEPDEPTGPKEPDTPEEPVEPENPEKPNYPDESENPEKAVEPKEPEEKIYGRILVKYQNDLMGEGILYLDKRGKTSLVSIPRTGDETPWELYVAGILLSVFCGLCMVSVRRKTDED